EGVRLALDLLKQEHVWLALLQPVRNVLLTLTDRVDVPGGDLHRRLLSKLDENLAEYVAAFQSCETCAEVVERIHRVDHWPHTGCDAIQRAAECTERRAERTDDAILLLEELHQVDAAGRSRCRAAGHQTT